jgi:protein gp37
MMGQTTGISWCDSTANLWIGCSKVSAACDHCYAENMMGGLGEAAKPGEGRRLRRVCWGPEGDRSFCKSGWNDLMRWQRAAERNGGLDPELGRKRWVFINSLSDFFDNHRSVIWRPDAWALFRKCTHLILILVTKRPQLIARELPDFWDEIADRIILLTTAENQQWADLRIPELLASTAGRAPAGCFGASFEPLLGRIEPPSAWFDGSLGGKLGWGIVGGESGKDARIMHPAWADGLLIHLEAWGVPGHFKQWGEWKPWAPGDGDALIRHISAQDSAIGEQPGFVSVPDESHALGYRVQVRGDTRPMSRVGKIRAGHLIGGRELLERPTL